MERKVIITITAKGQEISACNLPTEKWFTPKPHLCPLREAMKATVGNFNEERWSFKTINN